MGMEILWLYQNADKTTDKTSAVCRLRTKVYSYTGENYYFLEGVGYV